MSELFLKFTDKNGDEKEVCVEQEEFVIGRHSENDLTIINSKLSRQHVKIQRFADVFIISDLGSSNGTTINDEDLDEPIALKNGDVINLGGGLEIEVESDDIDADVEDSASEDDSDNEKTSAASASSAGGSSASNISNASSQTSSGSGIGKALILAPILGLFLIVSVVGAVILINGLPEKEIAQNDETSNDFIRTSTPDDIDTEIEDDEPTPKPVNTETPETIPINEQTPTNVQTPTDTSTPVVDEPKPDSPSVKEESDEIGKIRGHSFKFMRKIARSNQKPVLLSNQLRILESRIKPFRNSRALASNIKNAQSNASAIQELARSKNLKPQFLVTAALAKLGNSSGNVLAKAREMAEPLDNLNIQIGDEQADDNLIVIAAYNQGVAGQTLKMRNTLQRLAGKNPNRASEIRTIWFLKEKNEISDAQFNLALRFLAIGTITQNPSAYSVNAKALNL